MFSSKQITFFFTLRLKIQSGIKINVILPGVVLRNAEKAYTQAGNDRYFNIVCFVSCFFVYFIFVANIVF